MITFYSYFELQDDFILLFLLPTFPRLFLYNNFSIFFQSYPNPTRPSRLKLKYYEFAGRVVGKCIFESSCSAIRRLNVKARFMRSFLAQLIGLRVNYKVRLVFIFCYY